MHVVFLFECWVMLICLLNCTSQGLQSQKYLFKKFKVYINLCSSISKCICCVQYLYPGFFLFFFFPHKFTSKQSRATESDEFEIMFGYWCTEINSRSNSSSIGIHRWAHLPSFVKADSNKQQSSKTIFENNSADSVRSCLISAIPYHLGGHQGVDICRSQH